MQGVSLCVYQHFSYLLLPLVSSSYLPVAEHYNGVSDRPVSSSVVVKVVVLKWPPLFAGATTFVWSQYSTSSATFSDIMVGVAKYSR